MASVDNVTTRFAHLSSSQPYRYSALKKGEFRLLELFDASSTTRPGDNTVFGRIITKSLDDAPDYRSLSYTWGNPILNCKLIVSDDLSGTKESAVLYITEALYLALRRFQSRPTLKYIWIDQICINQSDLDECSVQVLVMRQIYQSSFQTIMWIGEPKQPKDLPLITELLSFLEGNKLSNEELVERIPAMRLKRPVAYDRVPDRKSQIQGCHDQVILAKEIEVRKLNYHTIAKQRHQAVLNIFNQPYFKRAWVVQEIPVSREVRVQYGDLDIAFEALDRLGVAVMETEILAMGWMEALHNSTAGYGGFGYITRYKRNQGQEEMTDEGFIDFLHGMQSNFECTKPHDKLYSFLGLKSKGSPPYITPDYKKPVVEVFAECARSIIEKTRSLKLFGIVEGNSVWWCSFSFPIANLPSWAPNWCQHFHGVYSIDFGLPTQFRAARCLPFKEDGFTLPSDLTLTVRGKIAGKIKRVLPQNFDNRNSHFDGLQTVAAGCYCSLSRSARCH